MSAETLNQLRSGVLAGAVRLELRGGLTELPREVLGLADSLEVLDVSGNQLEALPDWLPELRRLRVVFGSQNPFRELPEVLGACGALEVAGFRGCQIRHVSDAALPGSLRSLILTENRLTELPGNLGRCGRLQKLMLSGNSLRALPPGLQECGELEMLRVAANELHAFPRWLWELPALAWLAAAGNSCTASVPESSGDFREVAWQDLQMGALLGQGASGMIHAAEWNTGPGAALPVAVKLFKGAMTSDGLPESEMAASLAAGGHKGLCGALGRLSGHPQGTAGLVLPRLRPGCRPLAGPPSLESCTRDIYSPAAVFSAEEAISILRSIAAAAQYLHSRGLMHGDLYAHNILHEPGAATLLSDFGAASPYPPGPAGMIQRMEVRAFGVLMEEMLSRWGDAGGPPAALLQLAADCAQPEVAARPDFAAVTAVLQG